MLSRALSADSDRTTSIGLVHKKGEMGSLLRMPSVFCLIFRDALQFFAGVTAERAQSSTPLTVEVAVAEVLYLLRPLTQRECNAYRFLLQ